MELLKNAYKQSLLRAQELQLKHVAFCIISGGIFRGNQPLSNIIQIALFAIAKNVYPGLESVFLCGFTPDECKVIEEVTTSPDGDLNLTDPFPQTMIANDRKQ